jgi:putative membrane protein
MPLMLQVQISAKPSPRASDQVTEDKLMDFSIFKILALSAALVAHPVIAQEVPAKSAGDAAAMMVMERSTFASMASSANEFEIKSSELALKSAENAELKKAAQMIIKDHKAAGEKLSSTLKAKGAPLASPVDLAPKHQFMLDQLQAVKGKDFDMLYLDMQTQAHMEAVSLFRTYAGSGDDQAVVGFARETLPSLETHLAHVKLLISRM